jgi:PAS domain S-box-containing protein
LSSLTVHQSDTPHVTAQVIEQIRPALARDRIWSGESELRGKDGRTVPVHRLVVGLDDAPGRPTIVGTIIRDLTEERRAKRQLRRFLALADATPDLVATVELSGAVTYVNPAGMEMLGRAGQDFRSLKLHDVADPALKRTFTGVIFPTAREKGVWSGEIELLQEGRSAVPVSLVVLLLRDGRGEPSGFGAIARDLREQKAMEAALEQAVRDMSTPMLVVSEGVLALPILGRVGEARAAQMTEALLRKIVETRCRVAVLDLTGASDPDAAMMRALLLMTRAAELLGCRCFLCGASPAAARTMTEAEVDLGGVRAFGTLKDALHAAAEIAGT